MNIFEFFGIQSPGAMPAPPRETLETILERLNGDAENATRVGQAMAESEIALPQWEAFREKEMPAHRKGTTDTTKLTKLRALEDRADSEIELLRDGREGLKQRFTKAQTRARKDAEPGLVAEDQALFEDYCAGLRALAEADRKRNELQVRARQILGDARANVLLPPARIYGGYLTADHIDPWIQRQARDLHTSETMSQAPLAVIPAPAPRTAPKPRQSPGSTQHAVRLGEDDRAIISHDEAYPDDVGPLEDGNVWQRVEKSGYPHPKTGRQMQRGCVFQGARSVAVAAMRNAAVTILTDRPSAADAVGADWKPMPAEGASLTSAAGAVAPLTAPRS